MSNLVKPLAIPADLRRVQFDVLPERLAQLDELMLFCDFRSRKELFDNAITLFEWAVAERRSGKEIGSLNKEKSRMEVVRFPALDNAARRQAASVEVSLIDTTGSTKAPGRPRTKIAG